MEPDIDTTLRWLSKTPPAGTPGRSSKSDQSTLAQADRGVFTITGLIRSAYIKEPDH